MARVPQQESPIDPTLRRIVIALRLLAWAWMMLLVTVVLANDHAARPEVAIGATVLATVWTGFFLWVAQSHDRLRSVWFVVADGFVILLIGAASSVAQSEALFHGGVLISWLAVAAYGGGLAWALVAALLLTVEQVIVHGVDNRGLEGAFGSVVFFVMAILLGWAFDAVRAQTSKLMEAEHALSLAEQDNTRQHERERLANRLHDSVLQTLLVIRRDADDPEHVRFLARRQERDLRRTIDEYRMPYADSFIVAISGVRDDVEDVHRVEINTVLRGDAPMTEDLAAVVRATKEALTNAAKHSGSRSIDLYSAADQKGVQVAVRDRGTGFDASDHRRSGGLAHGIVERVERAGGTTEVRSTPGQGTEIVIEMEIG